MDFVSVAKKRRSVKNYSKKFLDWRKIIRAVDLARYAPSAGNTSYINYIVVNDPKLISELAVASHQNFVGRAPYVVVVVSDYSKLQITFKDRAEDYGQKGAGAAIENLLLAFTNYNLSACWVGFFDDNKVKNALKIPDKLKVEGIFPVGIGARADSNIEKRKQPLDNVIYFNEFKNKYMSPVKIISVKNS